MITKNIFERNAIVGFGGARFNVAEGERRCVGIVRKAAELGIDLFDTAPDYCNGDSEKIIGKGLLGAVGEKARIITKTYRSDRVKIEKDIAGSFARLQKDHVWGYAIWGIVHFSDLLDRIESGVLDTMVRLRDNGLFAHVGMSTHLFPEQLEKAADLVADVVDFLIIPINPFCSGAMIETVRTLSARFDIIAMNPLGGGLVIARPDLVSWLPNSAEDPVAATIRYNKSIPGLSAQLVGFSSEKEVEAAIAATALPSIGRASDPDRDMTRFCSTCGYCLPCPGKLPLPQIMECLNFCKEPNVKDMLMINERLRTRWQISEPVSKLIAKCSKCGACSKRCTQHLSVCETLQKLSCLSFAKL